MRKACLTVACWCWKFLADTSICNFCWCCKVKQMPHILSVTVIMPQLMAKKQIVFFLLATLMVDFTIKVIKLLDNNMNLIRKKSLISQLDYCFGCVNLAVMLWFLVSYIERNVIFKGMFGLLMLSRKEKKEGKGWDCYQFIVISSILRVSILEHGEFSYSQYCSLKK